MARKRGQSTVVQRTQAQTTNEQRDAPARHLEQR